MNTCIVFLLVFLVRCSESASSSNPIEYNEEYLNPKSLDHKLISGRWYEHMSTLNHAIIDNLFGDAVVLCDDTQTIVDVSYRWISSLQECRTTAFRFEFDKPDSPRAAVIRMSTNEHFGRFTTLYYDPHPTRGFILSRQHTNLHDGYHIGTREREPQDLDDVIKKVLSALRLNIQDFHVKSKDFGCERKEEKGIKL